MFSVEEACGTKHRNITVTSATTICTYESMHTYVYSMDLVSGVLMFMELH